MKGNAEAPVLQSTDLLCFLFPKTHLTAKWGTGCCGANVRGDKAEDCERVEANSGNLSKSVKTL